MIAGAVGGWRRAGAAHRDVLDRLFVRHARHRRARGRSVGTVPLAQAAEHGVWVGGSCPEISPDAPADDQRPSNSFVLAGPERATAPVPEDPSVLPRRRRAVRAGRHRLRDRRGRRGPAEPVRLLRPAIRRRILGARRPDRRVPGRGELACQASSALVDTAAGAGDREPGVRRGSQSCRIRRRARLQRRQRRHRPARRGARLRCRGRNGAVRRHRPGPRRRHPASTSGFCRIAADRSRPVRRRPLSRRNVSRTRGDASATPRSRATSAGRLRRSPAWRGSAATGRSAGRR